MWSFLLTFRPECTKHVQSLANFVANFHSQEFLQRGRNFAIIRKSIRIRNRIPSQCLIRNFLFEIWWLEFASEFSGRVRIRIRIRSRIAETPLHSGGKCCGKVRGPSCWKSVVAHTLPHAWRELPKCLDGRRVEIMHRTKSKHLNFSRTAY